MKKRKIYNYSNASLLTEQVLFPSRLAMIKFENTFNFYSEEPISISVQTDKYVDDEVFEPIIRIREWGADKCSAWSIYSKERERISNIIVRKVVWNKVADRNEFIKGDERSYNEKLNDWPSIQCDNVYICESNTRNLDMIIREIDQYLQRGIGIDSAKMNNEKSKDMEFLRLYNWGQIHFTWALCKEVEEIEKKIKIICTEMDTFLIDYPDNIVSMKLNYSISEETYRQIYILGEGR